MASTDKAILTEGQLSTLMTRIKEAGQGGGGVQSDWDEMDSTSPAYIKNRIAYSTKYTINPETLTPITPSSDGYTALSPYFYVNNARDPETSKWTDYPYAQESLTGNAVPGLGEDPWVKNVFLEMMSHTSFEYTSVNASLHTWVIAEQGALKGLFYEVVNDSSWDFYKYQFTDGVASPLTKQGTFRKYTVASGTFAGEDVVAGDFGNGSGSNILVVLWRDMAFVATRDFNNIVLVPYTLTRVQGEIKTVDPSLLPEATSTVKGAIALSQVGDSVATGEYLSKTLNQQGLTEINLRSSGIVDYEVNASNSPEYLKNRPFYTIPAGQSYTETGACSGVYLTLNSTIEQALAWDPDMQMNYPYMTYSVGPEDFSYQSGSRTNHVYYFLPDADVISAIRSGGQATVTGIQRVINEMAGTDDEYPFSFTGTFTRYNDDAYYADVHSYMRLILVNLTQMSLSGQTLPSGWTLCAIWRDSNQMEVVRTIQKPMTFSAQTTTETVKQLDSKYIKLDPNVFEINAQGQITIKTNLEPTN